MAKVQVVNQKGEKVKDLTLKDSVWNIEVNEAVMHDAIILAQASLRQGTASTKTRSEVSGGGRKPYKQKGTGNARQGSTRSPQWPGGGIVFGPKPRNYDKKQNKKERRLALKSALTSKFKDKELIVVDTLNMDTNKTKSFNEMLKNFKVTGKAVVVYADDNENLFLASRNNQNVAVLSYDEINVLDLVASNYLVIDESSVNKIEEKSETLKLQNVYVFKVNKKANKTQIKNEIEKRFGVKVLNVNTLNAVQKKRRVGRYTGLAAAYKKAYVKLAEGSSIEY